LPPAARNKEGRKKGYLRNSTPFHVIFPRKQPSAFACPVSETNASERLEVSGVVSIVERNFMKDVPA
jgi:hypothetical protein